MGLGYLSCSSGKFWYEVEICKSGYLSIGIAGTGFRCSMAGSDSEGASWGLYIDDKTHHRHVPGLSFPGWCKSGQTLGVAADLEAGTLHFALDSDSHKIDWTPAYLSGVVPGLAVGPALFPVISGYNFSQVRCNFGTDPSRLLRLKPPSNDYLPFARTAAAQRNVGQVGTDQHHRDVGTYPCHDTELHCMLKVTAHQYITVVEFSGLVAMFWLHQGFVRVLPQQPWHLA